MLPVAPIFQITPNSSDMDIGTFALSIYWQAALNQNSQAPATWAEFLEVIRRAYYPRDASEAPVGYESWKKVYYPSKSEEALEVFIDGLGLGIRSVDLNLSADEIRHAMEELAANTQGQIPATSNLYFSAIQGQAANPGFFTMASFVATESLSDIAHGAEIVGEGILDTGALILKYRNYLLVAGVLIAGYVAYHYYGSMLGFKRNPGRKRRSGSRARRSKRKAKLVEPQGPSLHETIQEKLAE